MIARNSNIIPRRFSTRDYISSSIRKCSSLWLGIPLISCLPAGRYVPNSKRQNTLCEHVYEWKFDCWKKLWHGYVARL